MTRVATQRQVVEQLLLNGGERGFTAYDAIYTHGITRAATYVHDLRQEGWPIETETLPGHTARYYLTGTPPGMQRTDQQSMGF